MEIEEKGQNSSHMLYKRKVEDEEITTLSYYHLLSRPGPTPPLPPLSTRSDAAASPSNTTSSRSQPPLDPTMPPPHLPSHTKFDDAIVSPLRSNTVSSPSPSTPVFTASMRFERKRTINWGELIDRFGYIFFIGSGIEPNPLTNSWHKLPCLWCVYLDVDRVWHRLTIDPCQTRIDCVWHVSCVYTCPIHVGHGYTTLWVVSVLHRTS